MIDWLRIDKITIFSGKDKNGNRYLSQFLSDYKKVFNPKDVNAGCQRCLEDYYLNLINYLQMNTKKEESGYVLKAKYNGIPLKFGSPILVTNTNITKAYGDTLLKNHVKGADLFDKIPDEGESSELDGLKRNELDAIATNLGLTPGDYKNKTEITDAIQEKQKEVSQIDTDPED